MEKQAHYAKWLVLRATEFIYRNGDIFDKKLVETSGQLKESIKVELNIPPKGKYTIKNVYPQETSTQPSSDSSVQTSGSTASSSRSSYEKSPSQSLDMQRQSQSFNITQLFRQPSTSALHSNDANHQSSATSTSNTSPPSGARPVNANYGVGLQAIAHAFLTQKNKTLDKSQLIALAQLILEKKSGSTVMLIQ